MGVEYVIESTGLFVEAEKVQHLDINVQKQMIL